MNILRNLRSLSLAILDGLVLLIHPFRARGNKVLVVRTDAIGDFVLWLDAAKTLIAHYQTQGRTVVLIGNEAWTEWAEEMKLADEVWSIDPIRFFRNLPYRCKWLLRIRKEGFDVVIQPTFSRFFQIGDSLVRASAAPERIGSEGDLNNIHPWFNLWSNHWYTRLIPAASRSLMELRRNAEFMREIGFTDFQARLPIIPQLSIEHLFKLPQRPYAVIFPAAGWAGRVWPVENYAEIARRLAGLSLKIVVAGGSEDSLLADYLVVALPGHIVDLVDKTSLGVLAEVLRAADIVVTNETSAAHIGAAVGVPVVCILGGGHFGRFVPYEIDVQDDSKLPFFVAQHMPCFNCNWKCIYPHSNDGPVKCIEDISVEKVWKTVEMVLAKRNNTFSE
ncbi:MAG: glycosyltransferase family 9 protein [Phycisphaerae bacterium]|nr:glycosyltransferase family 9 protein [Saprospiraceae bacterium]